MARLRAPLIAIRPPSTAGFGSTDLILGATLFLVVVLPLLLFTAGAGIRRGLGTPVVINEVLVAPKTGSEAWAEIYNATDMPVVLDGWQIASTRGNLAALEGTIAPRSFRVARVPTGAWEATGDAVFLKRRNGDAFDSMGWGTFKSAETPVVSGNTTPGVAFVRNPQGLDSDTAKDFAPAPPTPGTRSPASLRPATYRLLFDATNYLSLIAGFLLWGAFMLIGLVARRFEMLTGQRTMWAVMMAGPLGIVIYNVIQANAFFQKGIMTTCKTPAGAWTFRFAECEQGWAFSALFLAAVTMTFIIHRFYQIARRILEI